jgi:hypothetical protein
VGQSGWLGAWVSTRDAELIYHPAAVTGLRRDQIAVHHLCHMLLGHHGRPAAGLAELIAPGVSPQLAEFMLGSAEAPPSDRPYADEEEQSAEAMSSMILARASWFPWPVWPALTGRDIDGESVRLVRLEAALRDPRIGDVARLCARIAGIDLNFA